MKKIGISTVLLVILITSCQKQSGDLQVGPDNLDKADSIASVQMSNELTLMTAAIDSLVVSTSSAHRQHWDNLYHQHDSLFWHHHNPYNHDTYTHDDHSHQWVPYNPAISHTSHFHHTYPNHPNDSLVTHPNLHHPAFVTPHFNGHHIQHHHTLDSLHHLHNSHHP